MPSHLRFAVIALTAVAFVAGGNLAHAQVGKKKGDKRVAAALDAAELKYEVTPEGDFKLLYQLDDDRTQILYVNSNTEKLGTIEIREVWSIAMNSEEELDAETAGDLLTESGKVKIGGWRVSVGDDENQIVYFSAQVDADADTQSLAQVILAVVQTADAKEQELTEDDEY